MDTHDQLVRKLMRRLGVRAEAERIEREESVLFDTRLRRGKKRGILKERWRLEWGHAPAIARLDTGACQREAFSID